MCFSPHSRGQGTAPHGPQLLLPPGIAFVCLFVCFFHCLHRVWVLLTMLAPLKELGPLTIYAPRTLKDSPALLQKRPEVFILCLKICGDTTALRLWGALLLHLCCALVSSHTHSAGMLVRLKPGCECLLALWGGEKIIIMKPFLHNTRATAAGSASNWHVPTPAGKSVEGRRECRVATFPFP